MARRSLSPSEQAELRAIIDDERRRTSGQVAELRRDLDSIIEGTSVGPPDDEHDPEGATIGFERAQVASLLDRARSNLTELVRAQERLDAGTYGACQRCGESIEMERLTAHPTAPTCMRCAARADHRLRS